jgi:hypothetical protein
MRRNTWPHDTRTEHGRPADEEISFTHFRLRLYIRTGIASSLPPNRTLVTPAARDMDTGASLSLFKLDADIGACAG